MSAPVKDDIRSHWEYKSAKFVLRAVGVLFFIAYLAFFTNSAWQWAVTKWVRHQPLAAVMDIDRAEPGAVTRWIARRPASDRAGIMKLLEPDAGNIPPSAFMLFSRWREDAGDMPDALFWRQYALYRFRFDALRCGSPEATKKLSGWTALYPHADVQQYLEENPAMLPKSIQRVLDFDQSHPADNSPAETCDMITLNDDLKFQLVSPENWPEIRKTLRRVTAFELKKIQAGEK